jgi:hypothetical protein
MKIVVVAFYFRFNNLLEWQRGVFRVLLHQHPIVAFASSQICAAPFAEILEGLFCKVVEPPIQGVLLKLPVPRLGIEPIEPLPKRREIRP